MKRLVLLAILILGLIGTQIQATDIIKPRVLVSTDIGGTDPDDNQSMAHLLMYTDCLDLEGIVSSPSYGSGNREEILRMIDLYEKDLPKLSEHIKGLMSPAELRAITKQGRKGAAPYRGFLTPTEGSRWIVQCARGYLCGADLTTWLKPFTMRLTLLTKSVSTGLEVLTKSGVLTVMPI